MNYKVSKILYFFSIVLLVILLWSPFILSNLPARNVYLSLSVTGENIQPSGILQTNDLIEWNLTIHNSLEKTQYVKILIKIMDASAEAPLVDPGAPSDADLIHETQAVILPKQSHIHHFYWQIPTDNNTNFNVISEIIVNNIPRYVKIESEGGKYALLFELWTYSPESDAFEYGYTIRNEKLVVWNLISFQLT